MEDAATAEISRVQVWHWATHEVKAAEGTTITRALVKDMVNAQGVKFQVNTYTKHMQQCAYMHVHANASMHCCISASLLSAV
jgi:malate synthase